MIIVTGAAGFIGSVLVHELNKLGREDIICVDRFEGDQKWLNLRGLKYYEFIHADDFIEEGITESIFESGVEAIYHMGACSSTTETDVDYLWKNNVEYSQILFKLATQYDTPICYASSAATYGNGEHGYNDTHDDNYKLIPLNPYGYSKHVFDEWVLKQKELPTNWYGVKFFNVFGPQEYHKEKMSSVVFQTFNQIQDSGKMKLFKSHKEGFKDGEQLRDFVYVKDIVRAMIALVTTDHSGECGLYNLGTGKARSFFDLAKATFSALGKKENIEFIDMPENLRGQYQYFTQANMDKFNHAIKNFSFLSLEEAVDDYVNSHLIENDQYLNSRQE